MIFRRLVVSKRCSQQSFALGASALAMTAAISSPLSAQTISPESLPAASAEADRAQASSGSAIEPSAMQAAPAEQSTAAGEIVVTGSRVTRDGYQAPTPVTVASSEQLELAAPSTLSDALNQLPAFRSSGRPQNVSVASTGTNGGSYLNLRALGSQRTLILLDGKRIVPSSGSGVPDTGILPQELVQRVEVVTGGASAAYGSDAVAGVVNFILDTNYRGLKGGIQTGISTYGDNHSIKGSLTAGTSFSDDRGRIVFSGEYYQSDPVNDPGGRDWANANWGLIPNTAGESPRLVLVDNVTNSHNTFGGLITAGPLAGIEFLSGGVPDPFQYGALRSPVYMVGGDGIIDFINISAGVERWSLFSRVGYDITPDIEIYAEASLGQARTKYNQRSPGSVAANRLEIFSGNPFLPESIQDRMTAEDIPSFLMGRTHRDFGPINADSTNRTWRVVGGVNAQLGNGWTANAYYTHGENNFLVFTRGNLNYRNLFAAADAVRDPVSGEIICRSTLAGLDRGCVPINLFGDGSPSREAIDFVTGDSFYDMTLKQDVVAGSVQGSPFELWAGPVDVAFGLEYRKESADQVVDHISLTTLTGDGLRGFPAGNEGNRGGWSHTNPQPISGGYDIKEGFLEAVVPLAVDQSWAQDLKLNGAVRLTDYSTSGSVVTWKLGLSYQPFDDLRFRGTRSRDIRAANITELFTGSRQSSGLLREPGTGASRNFVGSTQGNPNLDPEKADTLTAGVVYQPSWIPNFSISVDYFDIKISGAVSSFSAQETLNQCAAGSQLACDLIVDNNGVYQITLPFLNLNSLATRGVDFEASYRTELFGGDIGFRALLTYTDRLVEVGPDGVSDDLAGDVGDAGIPKWAGTFNITYGNGPFSAFIQERFISGGLYDRTLEEGVDLADNDLPAVFYTDLTLRYDLFDNESVMLFGTVNNLFNRTPPIAPQQSSERFRATNFGLYDTIGRYFTAGVKFKF